MFPELDSAPWVADLEDELASFPGALHDDCVDAICQGLNRLRSASGGVLGMVEMLKDIFSGKTKLRPLPAQAIAKLVSPVASSRPFVEKFVCPACQSKSTVRLGAPSTIHCNQCSHDFTPDGHLLPMPSTISVGVNCCPHPLLQKFNSFTRCANCGKQSTDPQPIGVSRSWWQSHRGSTRFPNKKKLRPQGDMVGPVSDNAVIRSCP